jgi:hypothetical protein
MAIQLYIFFLYYIVLLFEDKTKERPGAKVTKYYTTQYPVQSSTVQQVTLV